MEKIISSRVTAESRELLDCRGRIWQKDLQVIETAATPLANQPSAYIKAVYEEEMIGAVKKIYVKSVHNRTDIFFYFEWESPRPVSQAGDINVFPDAIALLFPFREVEKTQINEMGSRDYPTNSWFWRPDFAEKPRNQVSYGLSTSAYTEKTSIRSDSVWENGRWKVVMGRPLTVGREGEESVDFYPGRKTGVGIGAWSGADGERGGIKAFSREWMELLVEA